MGIIYSLQTWH